MKLFKKKDKVKKVKGATKMKLFLTSSLFFDAAYGPSSEPFPTKEIEKAQKTLTPDDVRDALTKLKAWNLGLPEPQKQLRDGLDSLLNAM